MNNRTPKTLPPTLVAALKRRNCGISCNRRGAQWFEDSGEPPEYTTMESVFHCFQLDGESFLGVAGDGDNGSYEWFLFLDGKLRTSDSGFGCTLYALKEAINIFVK